MSDFVHLHLHSSQSVLDGIGSAEDYASEAKRLEFDALTLTDHASVDGVLKFQKACQNVQIKPNFGVEFYIVDDIYKKPKEEKRNHILLLAKNNAGFTLICKLLSIANIDGFYYKPRISFSLLTEYDLSNVVVLTACCASFILHPKAETILTQLQECNADIFFEIMPHVDFLPQLVVHETIKRLREKFDIPLVATADVHYPRKEDKKIKDVVTAIQKKTSLEEVLKNQKTVGDLYLKTRKEMFQSFMEQGHWDKEEIIEALNNTLVVSNLCNLTIGKRKMLLPIVPQLKSEIENGVSEAEILKKLCFEGYKEIFGDNIQNSPEYYERFNSELKTIVSKQFERYFLIVWEVTNWCRTNNIMYGPRGSCGGSLIAFLLRINTVDPLKFGLLFSRFIDLQRDSLPDIDLDLAHNKRHLVRLHLEDLYGKNNVVGISTTLTLKAKSVVRDVSRVFNVPLNEVGDFCKGIKATETIEMYSEGEGSWFAEKYPEVIEYATKMEGMIKSKGVHPAAIVVSERNLNEGTKGCICRRKGEYVANWDIDDCEYMGLIKFDFLGLNTLSMLTEAKYLIQENHGKNIDYERLSLRDKNVYKTISNGNTVGIFQFSTYLLTDFAIKCNIQRFKDLAVALAIVRPGPLETGMVDEYLKRKTERVWEKQHPLYEEITKETLGILAYQESVMQVIYKMAGLSYSIADKIRKIISKKRDSKEFEQYREMFINGCLKEKTFNKKEAEQFWEHLLRWAGYGFNRCLSQDTVITRVSANQHTGREISVKDLYNDWNSKKSVGKALRWRGLKILSMQDDGIVRDGKAINIYCNGIKDVYEVTTFSGKKIKVTKNHRLLTQDGYKTTEHLTLDDSLIILSKWEKIKKGPLGQRAKGKTYSGCGVPYGKENPAYIDGRQIFLNNAKEKVLIRSQKKCEKCKKDSQNERFEFAHIKSLEENNGNYSKYHNENNILFLCNSCHKKLDYDKGERKTRYSKGFPTKADRIISINHVGKEETYDLEMENEEHNFIANGIVSHNSHAVEYATVAYWTMYVKTYYPKEFILASLNCSDLKKKELIEEARKLGMKIVPPKVGLSNSKKWTVKDNLLLTPFVELNGIGDAEVEKIAKYKRKPSLKGIFNVKRQVEQETKIEKLLNNIQAFDENPNSYPENINQYLKEPLFDVDIKMNIENKGYRNTSVSKCQKCSLRSECKSPIVTQIGITNITILGEYPSKEDDVHGKPFIGRVGDILWEELRRNGLKRELFNVMHVCRCYTNDVKSIQKKQIQECFKYSEEEILENETKIVLALGNTPVFALLKQEGGIMKLSGKNEYIKSINSHVYFCISPSNILRDDSKKGLFSSGIKVFADKIKELSE